MDKSIRAESILRHIIEHCQRICALQERFGKDIEIFLSDMAYYDAVFMNLLQIGELAKHLSPQFRNEHEAIQWGRIIDLRNSIVHGYGTVKAKLLWQTICDDVPELHAQILEILEKTDKN